MKLYFRNSIGKDRLISERKDYKEIDKDIDNFLRDHNFKSYYSRTWYELKGDKTVHGIREEGRFVFDVGSHSEFFEMYVSEEEVMSLPENLQKLYYETINIK